ncbi:hypothetical protein COLO4_37478 [Corchorus olitorius]|uniref:Uncharacterized protein n=1 Tax=Corchorus olitorius TaxID=93759 RepID=A0A1R3G1F2_9ROSI|nr:hypothetical protein COLO4_37478 [Corchorus olitorius]
MIMAPFKPLNTTSPFRKDAKYRLQTMSNTNARMGNHNARTICGNQVDDSTDLEEWLPIPKTENLLLHTPNVQVLNYFMGDSVIPSWPSSDERFLDSTNLTLIMSVDDDPKPATPDTPPNYPMASDSIDLLSLQFTLDCLMDSPPFKTQKLLEESMSDLKDMFLFLTEDIEQLTALKLTRSSLCLEKMSSLALENSYCKNLITASQLVLLLISSRFSDNKAEIGYLKNFLFTLERTKLELRIMWSEGIHSYFNLDPKEEQERFHDFCFQYQERINMFCNLFSRKNAIEYSLELLYYDQETLLLVWSNLRKNIASL